MTNDLMSHKQQATWRRQRPFSRALSLYIMKAQDSVCRSVRPSAHPSVLCAFGDSPELRLPLKGSGVLDHLHCTAQHLTFGIVTTIKIIIKL